MIAHRIQNKLHIVPSLVRKYFELRALARLASKKKALVLTYDDGPSPRMTNAVLEILGQSGAKASFFMIGNSVEQNHSLAQKVANSGHEVGSHSMRHSNALDVGDKQATKDFLEGNDALVQSGIQPNIFRPPYGKLLPSTRKRCQQINMQLGWWTIDSGDCAKELPDIKSVTSQICKRSGGVVLMHDLDRTGDSGASRENYTLQLTQNLLELAEDRGMQLLTLGDLLSCHD